MREQFGEKVTLTGSSTVNGYTDGIQPNDAPGLANFMLAYDGSLWSRWHNNTQGILLASAARTGTTSSPMQTNYNGKGIIVYLNVTVASGSGGLQLTIRSTDPISGAVMVHNAYPTAITANGVYAYELYPGAITAGIAGTTNVQQRTGGLLPRTFNAAVTHLDGSSYTYSIGYALIL